MHDCYFNAGFFCAMVAGYIAWHGEKVCLLSWIDKLCVLLRGEVVSCRALVCC